MLLFFFELIKTAPFVLESYLESILVLFYFIEQFFNVEFNERVELKNVILLLKLAVWTADEPPGVIAKF